ncbi:MAG TPA: hypothetical protein VFP74_04160 [Pseudolabrys sp.]|nr:hypothetical protein [Pseudolabrys sp.]
MTVGDVPRDRTLNFVDTGQRPDDGGGQLRCPITGETCRGILAHLCEDYGCARKGGLSPNPGENA